MKTLTISGKILHKESGKGIPDLLVDLFDLDKWADPERRDTNAVTATNGTFAVRISRNCTKRGIESDLFTRTEMANLTSMCPKVISICSVELSRSLI